ncbi:McrB family protein [Aerosakkonemataceae cyanobacterium BLCC-F50]|uniref:McrB family protein n=1 Tax=Floridaenema flaviceps BLCC-F50 TaxID=3153642 RepID=A0ABV4XQX0_9CYAN
METEDQYPEYLFSAKTFEILEECATLREPSLSRYLSQIDVEQYLLSKYKVILSKIHVELKDYFIKFHGKGTVSWSRNFLESKFRLDNPRNDEIFIQVSHSLELPRKSENSLRLFISIWKDFLEFGIYGASANTKIFFDNCEEYKEELIKNFQRELEKETKMVYGFWNTVGQSRYTWEDLLKQPRKIGESVDEFNGVSSFLYAAIHINKQETIRLSADELSNQIAKTFKLLFPLALLAIYDDPIPALHQYIYINRKYPLAELAEHTSYEEFELERYIRAIERKKQAIFYGAPGTGKTFMAEKLAAHLIGENDGFSEIVQFHPAYSYEDFIQGIRPQSKEGKLSYSMVPGRFREFCQKAKSRKGICVLIIDEINRANLAQVFGELMYLLEYRDKEIPLAGGNSFSIPSNVRIIGTMNTADRSIALVDHALRRRFAFIEIRPNYNVLRRYHENKNTGFPVQGLINVLKDLNLAIADKNYQLGISFFLTERLAEYIEEIWKMEIEPYLEEYFFDRLETVDEFRWDNIKRQVYL